jgi:hypothetical protein
MTTDSYHIDIRFQGELQPSKPVRHPPGGSPGAISPAVRHMQHITGAPLSTARLLAELAGWALSPERTA